MPIDLTPLGNNVVRNNMDELLRFARLDLTIVQDYEVQDALWFAADEVAFLAPEAEPDTVEEERSDRVDPLRKRAEAYLATAELYERIATHLGTSTPPKQILTTLNISIGTDFPTNIGLLDAFSKVASKYRENGLRILKMLQPVTAAIEAGLSIDDE